jgi:hypothetical protein
LFQESAHRLPWEAVITMCQPPADPPWRKTLIPDDPGSIDIPVRATNTTDSNHHFDEQHGKVSEKHRNRALRGRLMSDRDSPVRRPCWSTRIRPEAQAGSLRRPVKDPAFAGVASARHPGAPGRVGTLTMHETSSSDAPEISGVTYSE